MDWGKIGEFALKAALILGAFLAVIVILLVAFGTYRATAPPTAVEGQEFSRNPEIYMSYWLIIFVVVLMGLLIGMAWVFKGLGVLNPREALGLPEGSVRALIALFLLIMFSIFSIYLFREVTIASGLQYFEGLTQAQRDAFGDRLFGAAQTPDGRFNIWVEKPDDISERFGQQIFTALLTLVTAVSSFYFASRMAEKVAEGAAPVTPLSLLSIAPSRGSVGGPVQVQIVGRGFVSGARAKLKRSTQPDIDGSDVRVLDDIRIECKFDLAGKSAGKWDVSVTNPDGKEARLPEGFEVTSSTGRP